MWLIVGLGNPGKKYLLTRHNIGFLAVDRFAKSLGVPEPTREERKALVSKFRLGEEEIVLAKPQTFMNLSGESVQALIQFYKVELDHLIVLHDEVDLPFAQMKIQKERGHGGHNGVRDIHAKLGGNNYARIRLGVGRPPHPAMQVADFVLQNFNDSEMAELPDFLDRCGDAIQALIEEGFAKAAGKFNGKE